MKLKTHTKTLVWGSIIFVWIVFLLAPLSPIEVPFEVIAYGLMGVVGSYTAIDGLASVAATRKLPQGMKYTGNRQKLLKITFAMILLSLTVIVCALLFPAIAYPVSTMLLSTFAIISFFVSSEKGKTAYESSGKTKEEEIEDLR